VPLNSFSFDRFLLTAPSCKKQSSKEHQSKKLYMKIPSSKKHTPKKQYSKKPHSKEKHHKKPHSKPNFSFDEQRRSNVEITPNDHENKQPVLTNQILYYRYYKYLFPYPKM
jgi:hypothetical protein